MRFGSPDSCTYGLAAGYLWVYVGINAYLYGVNAWFDVTAVAAVVAMLAHRPLLEWTWASMKRRFVRRRYGKKPPAELPVWERVMDYPANYVLTCYGLKFESAVPTGPGHGNAVSPLQDGQRIWTPL